MSTKRRASTRLAASSTTAVTMETTEDDVDVAALGRAVKRLNTGAEREEVEVAQQERSEYAEVNAMLRALHVERVRRAREREGAVTDVHGNS